MIGNGKPENASTTSTIWGNDMNHMVQKFVTTAKNVTSYKNMVNMPPNQILTYLMDQAERITKLAYVSKVEKDEGLNIIWKLYEKVQKRILNTTEDESWGNAKSNGKGVWSRLNNQEVDAVSFGNEFEAIIDSAQVPNPTTKVVRYDDD